MPGNHERSAIPHPLLARHPGLLVFDRPRTFHLSLGGLRVAVAGFPCEREARRRFRERLAASGWDRQPADVRLLCLHQAVEGARVGPSNFTFTTGADVVRAADLPSGLAAVLSGHIHRHQILTRDLAGRRLPCPVVYPGAIERTAFAEKGEAKGLVHLDLVPNVSSGGHVRALVFEALPTRPMLEHSLHVAGCDRAGLERRLQRLFTGLDPNAVLRLHLHGRPQPAAQPSLTAARLRRLAPKSMTVELVSGGRARLGHAPNLQSRPATGSPSRRFDTGRGGGP